jgi:hypothetical protein
VRWSLQHHLPAKTLALTSPTSGGRSVGIVRFRTKATEFSLVLDLRVSCDSFRILFPSCQGPPECRLSTRAAFLNVSFFQYFCSLEVYLRLVSVCAPSHTYAREQSENGCRLVRNPAELALSICSSFRMGQLENGRMDFHEEWCWGIYKKFRTNIANGNFACRPTCFSARISLNVYRTKNILN